MTDSCKTLQGLHLLVIDNEQDTREFLIFILRLEGADITTVSYFYEAIEVLEKFRPDVILINTHLPDGDAYMLLSFWKDKEAELGIEPVPAIILTESNRDIPKKRIYEAGFQAYISKPFDLKGVAQIVASVASACDTFRA